MSYFKLPIVFLSEMVSGKADTTNEYIASWLLRNKEDIQDYSLRELAARMNTSASSLSRFCRDIGLHDFNELKELSTINDTQFLKQSSCQTPESQKDSTLRAVVDGVTQACRSLDMDKIVQLARDIDQYERVAAFGVGKAEGVAMNLQIDLIAQGKYAVTKLPFSEQISYIESANENDLIIIFSFTGVYFNYGFPDFSGHPRLKKPKIYFITSDRKAAAAGKFDEVILFDSDQNYASHPYQLQIIADIISQQYVDIRAK